MSRIRSDEADAVWRLVSSTTALESPWIRVLRNEYRRPTGDVIADYYVVERSEFVMVVPQVDDNVILVRQYRPATNRMYLALPAGYIDSGESPQDAAVRELREETGYMAVEPLVLGSLDPLPGYIRSRCWVVLCGTTGLPAKSSGDEVHEVVLTPWNEVPDLMRRGCVDEMQTVASLALAQLRRSQGDGGA
jgi:ADP-ribose pyrophosphatase